MDVIFRLANLIGNAVILLSKVVVEIFNILAVPLIPKPSFVS